MKKRIVQIHLEVAEITDKTRATRSCDRVERRGVADSINDAISMYEPTYGRRASASFRSRMAGCVWCDHACTVCVVRTHYARGLWINVRRRDETRPDARICTRACIEAVVRRLIRFASSRRTNLFTLYTAGSNGRVGPIVRHAIHDYITEVTARRPARAPRAGNRIAMASIARQPVTTTVVVASASLLRAKLNRINSRQWMAWSGHRAECNYLRCAPREDRGTRRNVRLPPAREGTRCTHSPLHVHV